jgi:aspartyl aminopeptidase
MIKADLKVAQDLCSFIDSSPSPYHACASAARELEQAGFTRLHEVNGWDKLTGKHYVIRGGSLLAWATQDHHHHTTGFRVLGAHTDSPNLRIKPRPDAVRAGFRQLGVEVYGGVLLNSWLDRDLGLSGRVQLRTGTGTQERLFLIGHPVLKVPQLAIHLHREINTNGLLLNKQVHMQPIWGLGQAGEKGFRDWLGEELDVDPSSILSWDAMTHDVMPSSLIGAGREFVSAPRMDNLASTFSCLRSLIAATKSEKELEYIPVVALFDHEEVGSGSAAGAASSFLRTLLERTVIGRGGNHEDLHRAIADSLCVSLDMAHATHPNYREMHDSEHTLEINAGPVIKVNANERYATDSHTEAQFEVACEKAQIPYQKWVMRSDLGCGSTIGPITAQNLGMQCVDVGNPMLGMHSIRETGGSWDPDYIERALAHILV